MPPSAAAAGRAVRLGVDGPAGSGAVLADAVAEAVASRGHQVARVRADDFVETRSVRLEHGPDDVQAFYELHHDHAALRREVLDPLGDPAVMTWLPALRRAGSGAGSDRALRAEPRAAVPGAVAVVDGPYLLRRDLEGALDLVVHLHRSAASLAREHPEPSPVAGAWRRYVEECDPSARAALVVRYDHPARPAVLTR